MTKEQFGTSTAIYNKLFYNSRGQLSERREGTSYTGPTDTGWERGPSSITTAIIVAYVRRGRRVRPEAICDFLNVNISSLTPLRSYMTPLRSYNGYDFWLTKLNQFNGNYVSAEMVKAFITSLEYWQRFGP